MIKPESCGTRLAGSVRFAPRNIFANPKIAYALLFIFALTDLVNFVQLFSMKMNDNYTPIVIVSLAFLCVYDLLPYLLGNQYSRRYANLKTNDRLMIAMLAVVAVFVVLNVWLRIGTRDKLVSVEEVTLSGETITRSDPMALPISIAMALVSIATSVTSFYLSFVVNCPLFDEIRAVETEKKRIELEQLKLCEVLSELNVESPQEYAEHMNMEDFKRYKAQLFLAVQSVMSANDYFKELLMRFLGNPEDYNWIAQRDNKRLLEMINEVAEEVGCQDIEELYRMTDTNPDETFNMN